jgi:hypothetical protein
MKYLPWIIAISCLGTTIVTRTRPRGNPLLQTVVATSVVPISDKLLDLVLKKCEDSKKDLEANLNYHIICVGLSIGLVLGLGASLSVLLLKDRIFEKVLYLVVPLASLYFVTRFGGLAIVFAEARYALKGFSQEYFREQRVAGHHATNGIQASCLYVTNSFFDPYFREEGAVGLSLYELAFPLTLGLSHALSFYLLGEFTANWLVRVEVWVVYSLPILALYLGFYGGMRQVISSESANAAKLLIAHRIGRAVSFCFVFSVTILILLYQVDVRGLFSAIVLVQRTLFIQ